MKTTNQVHSEHARLIYQASRKASHAPPIITVRAFGGWFVESSDGLVSLESVTALNAYEANVIESQD